MPAVRRGDVSVVQSLLNHTEINPDLADCHGTTPLSLAARIAPSLHSLEVVKLLLGTGRVTVASKDCFGRTPLWWARRARNHDIEAVLMKDDGHDDTSERPGDDLPALIFHFSPMDKGSVCDICYRFLKKGEYEYTSRYKCWDCNMGDFDICEECYDAGGKCLDATGTHSLVPGPHSLAIALPQTGFPWADPRVMDLGTT